MSEKIQVVGADEMTLQEANTMLESKWWINKSNDEITKRQLFNDRLIMPWGLFHTAVEKSLGRGVYSHEFARPENLRKEFLGLADAPSMQDILDQIPKEKLVIVKI